MDKDQQIDQLTSINKQQFAQIAQLRFELGEMKRLLFGSKSERFVPVSSMDTAQLDLAGMMQQLATTPPAVEEVVVIKKKLTDHKPTGRLPIPDHLERVNIYLEPQQDVTGYRKVTEECTEQLDYVPGKLIVRRYIRPKYARDSADGTNSGQSDHCSEPAKANERCCFSAGSSARRWPSSTVQTPVRS